MNSLPPNDTFELPGGILAGGEVMAALEAHWPMASPEEARYEELTRPRQLPKKEEKELKHLARKVKLSAVERRRLRTLLKRRERTPAEVAEAAKLERRLEEEEPWRAEAIASATREMMGRRFIWRSIRPKDGSKFGDEALDKLGPFLVWLGNAILAKDPPGWVELLARNPKQVAKIIREYARSLAALRDKCPPRINDCIRRRDTPAVIAMKRLLVLEERTKLMPSEWDDRLNTAYTDAEARNHQCVKDSARNRKFVRDVLGKARTKRA